MSPDPESASPGRAPGTLAVAARLLRRFAAPEAKGIVLGLALILTQAGLAVLTPWPLKWVIDGALGGKPLPEAIERAARSIEAQGFQGAHAWALVLVLAGLMLAMQVVASAFNVASHYCLVSSGLRMVSTLRCRVFDHVQRLSLRFHDATTVGESLYRVTWDTYCVQSLFNGGLVPCLTQSVTLLGIGAVMFWRDPLAAAVAVAVAIPLLGLIRRLDRPMTERSLQAQERESAISARVQEALSGIRAVQAFGREDFEAERFRTQADASLQANLKLTVLQAASHGAVALLLAAGMAGIVVVAAGRVIDGRMDPGDVVLFVSYVAMIHKPIETLTYAAMEIQKSAAGARRVLELLDRAPDVRDAPGARDLPGRARGEIAFESVSFAYRPGEPVLRDVSLRIPAGRTVALVGPSGAGKTTLASLVLRFYDPTAGRIALDGNDLRELKLAALRRNTAIVLQDPVLFSSSVRENIAYGRPGATAREVTAAAEAAAAHEFLAALPQGYDTPIGERGMSLSGGQRQRLSIARAFLKDAPVLIMDEPTSALDAGTERVLMDATKRLMQGRTTIVIAHRLSTIRDADLIVAMDQGRIVETGTHDELIRKGGLYARLHEQQMRPPAPQPAGDRP